MDENNNTPETSPAADRSGAGASTPANSADAAAAGAAAPAHSVDPTPGAGVRPDAALATSTPGGEASAKRRRTRGLLIAGGAVLSTLLLAGGGIAVGAAIADEADDATSSVSDDQDGADSNDDDAADGDESSDDGDSDDTATGDVSNLGTDSADDVVAMIDAASAAGEGQPVSVDFDRDGSAEVTLEAEDGAETEVRVDASGEASVVSKEAAEQGDTAPQNVLDATAIAAIVDAALAETDGRIVEIEADDDGASPWDVTVLTADGTFVDIELDADFAVVASGSGD
jgi:hypothetical protein